MTAATAPTPAARVPDFAGTWALTRLAMRLDRVRLPLWAAAFVAMAAASVIAIDGLYPSLAAQIDAAASINRSPSLIALYGRIYDPSSLGELALIKLGGMGAALVGVLAGHTVLRHTRTEEETGRAELLGATVVGRYAPLTAGFVTAAGATLALGLATAVTLLATGLPATGSLAFGLAWAGAGIAFAGATAVFAQLTSAARTAMGLTGAALVGAYLARAVGDTSSGRSWVSWLSPIGWAQQVRPFAGARFAVLLLLAAAATIGVAGGYRLLRHRDLGRGVFADRLGRRRATAMLSSGWGLPWRLEYRLVLAWMTGATVLGSVLGAIASDVEDLLGEEGMQDLITALGGEKILSDAFLAAEMGAVGLFASGFAVLVTLRARREEVGGHAEALLATGLSRTRWLVGHAAVALVGATGLLAAAGLAAGTAHALATNDAGQVVRVFGAALVQLPAVAVFVGVTAVVVGWAPEHTGLAWATFVAALLVGEFGLAFGWSHWILDLSPFGHLPRLPGAEVDVVPLLALVVIAACLGLVGRVGLLRRDIG